MDKFGRMCLGLLIGVPFVLWGGVILRDLWIWFVVPVFDVPIITWVQAIGLNIVGAWFTAKIPKEEDPEPSFSYVTLAKTIVFLIIWGMAWLYHFFLY